MKNLMIIILVIVLLLLGTVIFAPSIVVTIDIENKTGQLLHMFALDLQNGKSRNIDIPPESSIPVTLYKGESLEQFNEKFFLILASNQQGDLFYYKMVKGTEINNGELIVVSDKFMEQK